MRAILPLATVVLCAGAAAANGQTLGSPEITCQVLLPSTPLPHDPGHTITMIQLAIPPGHDGHRHKHDTSEFLHVLSGSGSLSVDGRPDAKLEPGEVIVIPPHVPHQEHNPGTAPLVYATTFVAAQQDHIVTVYLGERDHPSGCPHRR